MFPPVIEVAGRLYLVKVWTLDGRPRKAFTARRLTKKEEKDYRRWQADFQREAWARLTAEKKK